MPDEPIPPSPPPSESPPSDTSAAPPPPPDRVAALESLLQSQAAQIQSLHDVVQGALVHRPIAGPAGSGDRITPELRQALRNKGVSDADIDRNGPLILPYIEVFAPELLGLVEGRVAPLAETVSLSEMAQDTEHFPYAHDKEIKTAMRKLMADAKKAGQPPLSPAAAYHTAVSMDLAAGETSRVRQLDATRRAESAGADASATSGLGHRSSTATGARAARAAAPRTAADLKQMSYEDRLKFYAANENTPVSNQ